MYLLDTNVVSMLDPRRQAQAPALVAWLTENGYRLFLSVITITDLEAGALKLRREGKADRAVEIERLVADVAQQFADRVLPVDIETARLVARLAEAVHQQPVALPDLLIAATAQRRGLTVVTRNVRDFGRLGIPVIDPWNALPGDA